MLFTAALCLTLSFLAWKTESIETRGRRLASTDSRGKSFCRRLQECRFVMNLDAISYEVIRYGVRYASAVN